MIPCLLVSQDTLLPILKEKLIYGWKNRSVCDARTIPGRRDDAHVRKPGHGRAGLPGCAGGISAAQVHPDASGVGSRDDRRRLCPGHPETGAGAAS